METSYAASGFDQSKVQRMLIICAKYLVNRMNQVSEVEGRGPTDPPPPPPYAFV